MKQLKFLKNITFDRKPIWYKDCIYDVLEEGTNSEGRTMYKLLSEDLQVRGIDVLLAGDFFEVIEKKDIPKTETKKEIKVEEAKVENKSFKKKNKGKK